MKSYSVLLTLLISTASAFAQPAIGCEKLLVFDTLAINKNIATQYSVLSMVNESNYEEMKKGIGASLTGYFSGNYDEFKKKRASFSSRFETASSSKLESSYFKHALSEVGAQAYSECLAKTEGKSISAWISNKDLSSYISVTVKNWNPGNATIKYTVAVATPENQPIELTSGSSQMLVFKRDPKKPFIAIFNATNKATLATDSTLVEFPVERKFSLKTEYQDISANMICGAGCQSNSSGCYDPTPASLVASPGYAIDKTTLKEIKREVIGGPGLQKMTPIWTELLNTEGDLKTLNGQPTACVGNSPHTQGHTRYTYSVSTSRQVLKEDQ